MKMDLSNYVSVPDILAAVKILHGQNATVLGYTVKKGTESVQGFMSMMLRVDVVVKLPPQILINTSLIIKRLPVIEAQLDVINECAIFQAEVAFFTRALPLLQEKCDQLPTVKCLVVHDTAIVMEDLCAMGYKNLGSSLNQVLGNNVIELSHVLLIVKKLALLHSASLDIDWMQILPKFLEQDNMFEGKSGELFQNFISTTMKAFIEMMNELYPDIDSKYSKWLLSPVCYDTITKFTKPESEIVNVLCHGDCWINNMMFKLDPDTKQPLDVKLIDFQAFRVAPPTRDILYFLYSCTGKRFRDENEAEISRTYVDAFNIAACRTLTLEEFNKNYGKSRLFGLAIAIVTRPMFLTDGFFPGDQEELTDHVYEDVMHGDHSQKYVTQFRTNQHFREEMKEIIDETIQVLDELEVV